MEIKCSGLYSAELVVEMEKMHCRNAFTFDNVIIKVKSFPSHMGPWDGADLRFL